MVDVFGSPTRVVTLGLEDRVATQPVAVLLSGAEVSVEYWGRWLTELASDTPVVAPVIRIRLEPARAQPQVRGADRGQITAPQATHGHRPA